MSTVTLKEGLNMSPYCGVCGHPKWSWRHSPNHPANAGNEDETHEFYEVILAIVASYEEPVKDADLHYDIRTIGRDVLIIALLVIPFYSIFALIEWVTK